MAGDTIREKRKQACLIIYKEAHSNAVDLLDEARILLEKGSNARAYFLSFTALEEISKAIHAADVFTGFCTYEDFQKFNKNHSGKVNRVLWAYNDANSHPHNLIWLGPDAEDVEMITTDEPRYQKRQNSLFVDIDDEMTVHIPRNKISFKDARGIVHIVDTALQRIWFVTEYEGNSIGTKGFMK